VRGQLSTVMDLRRLHSIKVPGLERCAHERASRLSGKHALLLAQR
jgi:hypothetical protein